MDNLSKNSVTKLSNVFDGLNYTLDMAMERISELEGISIETFKTKMQRERRLKKGRTEYPRTVEQLQKLWHA